MTHDASSSLPTDARGDEPDFKAVTAAADAVRRLVASVRKTQASPELLERVAAEANRLADALAPFDHPGPYAQRRLHLSLEDTAQDMEVPSEFFRYSPVIGPGNPIAPPVDFQVEGDGSVVAEHVFDAPYNGPPTAVHGGIVALVFDELLGTTGVMNRTGGFTGTLSIRYDALTPIGRPIRMRGFIDRQEGRKIFIRGTMHDGEILCAEAEGIFIQPKQSILKDALEKNRARDAAQDGA